MLTIILIIGFQYIILLHKYLDSLHFKAIISLNLLVPAILKQNWKTHYRHSTMPATYLNVVYASFYFDIQGNRQIFSSILMSADHILIVPIHLPSVLI